MKIYKLAIIAMAFAAMSCGSSTTDEPGNGNNNNPQTASKDVDYTTANAKSWGNYMAQVSSLLKQDSKALYEAWTKSYSGGADFATLFKSHAQGTGYTSVQDCISEIVEKSAEIANEVGVAKIGDPYNLYISGQTEEALYAVESWYSWHSRDDYTNNIYSVRNAYFGSLDGSVNPHSMSAVVATINPDLDKEVRDAIANTAKAIQNIPQPFRNNINSSEARAAMAACAELEDVLSNKLKPIIVTADPQALQTVVDQYVDGVVVPTYKTLMEKNSLLHDAVANFVKAPSDSKFEAICNAWLVAREPWEKSEAFLFGPVDALGLDPNMDSWPLDQDQIVKILNSGQFDNLNWTDGDSDDAIAAKQGVRGFHTLEFLVFKDGKARKVNH